MGKKTILVAEDSQTIRKMIVMGLRRAGYDIIEAVDGMQALGLTISKKPDLLLLDIMMPKLSGWEVCEKIRSTEEVQSIPIIIVTARNQMGDVKMAKRFFVSAYLAKPFSNDKLEAKIKEALANPPKIGTDKKEEVKPPPKKKPLFPIQMQGEIAVLTLSGEMDKAQMINDSVLKAIKEYSKKILIDMTHTSRVRTQSIVAISRAGGLAQGLGGKAKIVLHNQDVIKEFEAAEQLQLLDYYATIEEALTSFE